MDIIKENIKKRTDLTKHLEFIFHEEEVNIFLKKHKKLSLNKIYEDKNWVNYTSYFTRIWLNYLDESQFERIVSKKLNLADINIKNKYKSFS